MTPGIFRTGRRLAILLSAIAILLLAVPVAADAAKADKQGGPKVTVMTRNVSLGADLGPALAATTLAEAIDGGGVILHEVDATNFPERAKPLAREIADAEPDLVGLQEVALWRQQVPPMVSARACDRGQLRLPRPADAEARGPRRRLPGGRDPGGVRPGAARRSGRIERDARGGALGAELDGRLTMRDVILAKKGSSREDRGDGWRSLHDPVRAPPRWGLRDPGRARVGLDRGHGGQHVDRASASSTPTSRPSGRTRSERRRRRSCSRRVARSTPMSR